MRNILKLFVALALFVGATTASARDRAVHRIMTCNIRITGLPADTVEGRSWPSRRDVMIEHIRAQKPDIIAMQEVIYDSYAYCKAKLSDYFAFGFEGPEMDPYTDGYHFIGKNVLFFSRKRYEMTGAGGYWLSDDPLIGGSASWQTMRARHCNWVRLRDRHTGKEFRVIDVHLDHKVNEAKLQQISLVMREAAQYADDFGQILCGDFNSGRESDPVQAVHRAGWRDAYEQLHGTAEYGYTAHGFLGEERAKTKGKGRRIDYIFCHGCVEPLHCEVLRYQKGGIYPSDHFFMVADLRIE